MVHKIWDPFPEVQVGLERVKAIMSSELSINHPEVKAKIREYIDAPGKYLRAGLCLYLAREVEGEIPEGKLYLAASLEMLHLATLIHDDVIDHADVRRGVDAIHQQYSNRIAIYAGDYLLAYAGRLALIGTEKLNVDKEAFGFTNRRVIERILAGELSQLMNQNKSTMTMKDYLKQIKGKTAFLFALSCQIGAYHSGTSKKESRLAFNMGQAIGMAFQIKDDLIDYQLSEKDSGKPRMQDIRNGIYTAPILFAKQMRDGISLSSLSEKEGNWSENEISELYNKLENLGVFDKTEDLVRAYLSKFSGFGKRLQLLNFSTLETFVYQVMKRNF